MIEKRQKFLAVFTSDFKEEEFQPINTRNLEKKLVIRKDNYKRLKGNDNDTK